MKKTWFALLLAVVMLASMFVGCTQKPAEKPVEAAPVVTEAPKPTEAPKEEPKPTEEPAPEPTAEPKLESEPEPEGLHKLVVLNTLVKDIETVKSEDSRFNAYWLPSYRLPNLRTRGSVQSAFLFCCRLLLCVSMAGCSIVGSSSADWGAITQVDFNNLSAVGTLQFNDARSGRHFIKYAPVAFGTALYDFDFIRVRFHSIRSSSSMSTRTKL